ncbi:hypothetical protein CKSOR_00276 [Candidatus Kinetoplastibacterium sorsogonicusi]|uniref:Ubiquinone biosynthesis accessory factor UbiK n=1 Tax=Candidatus Kinetoplastidibacterium kentomonadis TaxID=1576550 RepID=A0A3Q8EY46_9PROT|nr:accessory factor UbiK family protein [Candidatus Kinetoplastibacterium sorsogonicusi]AWD32397.1 hypothetical protein CKSOR_00276 [Candidatus Kinetoplastibacterium sorsogonicusi]
MIHNPFLNNILEKFNNLVNNSDLVSIKNNLHNIGLESLKKLDLVTKDEFELQTEILENLINKVHDLSLQLKQLEEKIIKLENNQ